MPVAGTGTRSPMPNGCSRQSRSRAGYVSAKERASRSALQKTSPRQTSARAGAPLQVATGSTPPPPPCPTTAPTPAGPPVAAPRRRPAGPRRDRERELADAVPAGDGVGAADVVPGARPDLVELEP